MTNTFVIRGGSVGTVHFLYIYLCVCDRARACVCINKTYNVKYIIRGRGQRNRPDTGYAVATVTNNIPTGVRRAAVTRPIYAYIIRTYLFISMERCRYINKKKK